MNELPERKRRHFSDDQKATVVRRHLGDKVPVSDLADEYQIQPSQIFARRVPRGKRTRLRRKRSLAR